MEHQCEEPKCTYLGGMNDNDTWMCSHSDNPKAPGIVRYTKQKPSSWATTPKKKWARTWKEWFTKYGSFLAGDALQEAHNLYKKDIGEAYWADSKDLKDEENVY